MERINCFLCQTPLEIRTSKKDKPYLVCEDCGVQVFFRLRRGIERLKLLLDGRVSFADNFVLCRRCRVAVEKCPDNVEEPFFGKSGIRCPRCEKFLVEITKAEAQRK